MPFIPVPGVVQCNFRATYLSVPVENVLNFLTTETPVTPSLVQAIAEEALTEWVNEVVPNLSSSYSLREVHAADQSSATGSIFTAVPLAPVPGGQGGDPEPGNVAFCVSLRTAQRGRSFRGRTYFCGLTSGETNGNIFNADRAALLVGALEFIRENMIAVGGQLVVVSRFSGGAPRATGIATPVTAIFNVDLRVDSQRRRLD